MIEEEKTPEGLEFIDTPFGWGEDYDGMHTLSFMPNTDEERLAKAIIAAIDTDWSRVDVAAFRAIWDAKE